MLTVSSGELVPELRSEISCVAGRSELSGLSRVWFWSWFDYLQQGDQKKK